MLSKYKKVVLGVLVAVGAVASVALATHSDAAIWSGQDCSTNAIIKCGVSSPSDLRAKYNASSELQALYGHFGVTSAVMNSTMYSGTVTNSGDVVVNGKTVATGAMSVGRHQDDGSGCKGTPFNVGARTYYEGTTACRFGTNPNYTGQAAYVMLTSDGQFAGAILKPCGNIVPAKPVPPKPKPQSVTCDSLTATNGIGSDMVGASKLNFNFAAKAIASNGAVINNYTYNFGDGTTVTSGATTSHTYTQTGTYTATVTVNAVVNGKATQVTSATCKTTVKPYKATPKPPVVSCTSLQLITVANDTYNLKASAYATPGVANLQTAGSISGYTYTVKNSNGSTIKTVTKTSTATSSESGNFTLTPGTYTAQVVVHSNAGDKTGAQCTVQIPVPKPNEIQVCRLSDYTIVTINEKDFDSSKYSKDVSNCTKVQVCDTTTNQVVTVTKQEAENSKYSTDLSKCQQVTVCDTTTGQQVNVYPSQIDNQRYTTDMTKCTTAPVTPTAPSSTPLPVTGPVDTVMSVVGLGSLIAAASYYVASRRAING